jgi:hypothetical protein
MIRRRKTPPKVDLCVAKHSQQTTGGLCLAFAATNSQLTARHFKHYSC